MKKLLAVLFVTFLLTGCASTGSVDSLSKRFDENNKRLDQNFMIVKKVLDSQAKAIAELQPKKADLEANYSEADGDWNVTAPKSDGGAPPKSSEEDNKK